MSDWSAVRTWPSWTGVLVCWIGIVPPSGSSLAAALPGSRSISQLPSRNSRGRIFTLASVCTGRPSSSIRIRISARGLPGSGCSIATTLPTSTPAIRTGWRCLTLLAEWNTALTS